VGAGHRASDPGSVALAYSPGQEAPTDRLIASAMQTVRREPSASEAWTNLAALLLRRRRETSDASLYIHAEDALAAARDRDPGSVRVEILSAMLLLDRHRFAEASRAAERVIGAASADPTGHLLLGDARIETGDYEGAVRAYQHAMDLRPDLRSYERGAHVRWLHGDVDGAIELVALAIDSGSPRDLESIAWCWVELGRIEHARGRNDAALAAAARARGLVPAYLPAVALEARALRALDRRDEAIARLETVVRRAPSTEDLCALAELLEAAGRAEDAARRLAQAERLAADDPRPLAAYLARRGLRVQEALRLAEREIATRGTVQAHDTHALALLRAGRAREALAAIERALALGTPDASFHVHAALIHGALGDEARTMASLERARQIDPGADLVLVRGES